MISTKTERCDIFLESSSERTGFQYTYNIEKCSTVSYRWDVLNRVTSPIVKPNFVISFYLENNKCSFYTMWIITLWLWTHLTQ